MEKRYEIIIEALPDKYIPVLRILRELTGLGLKEAKELLSYVQSNCPCVLLAGVNQDLAENLTSRLKNVGAKAVIQESSMNQPMLVFPKLDERYQYHWFFGLRRRERPEA